MIKDLEDLAQILTRLDRVLSEPLKDIEYILHVGERRAQLPGSRIRATLAITDFRKVLNESIAHLMLEPGWSKEHHTIVFNELRELIEAAGYEANMSTDGPLVNLVQMIFDSIGEDSDAFQVIHHQLKKEKRRQKK